MKNSVLCFIIGLIVILISTPLAYKLVDVIYFNKNLSGEYVSILNGFIYSIMLIGFLIFSIGLLIKLKEK
ncbi:glycosyl transferase [Neobacillus sp. FSL H8-0543]|uniref:glycosyl transferase n=1 Tax=Neobacillus sp. FSL H8-0543 TaxID=2954672 RepID=UPI00315890CC